METHNTSEMQSGSKPSPIQSWLTSADVREICDLAQAAWDQAPGKTRQVRFRWRKIPLVSTLSSLRLLVNDAHGLRSRHSRTRLQPHYRG